MAPWLVPRTEDATPFAGTTTVAGVRLPAAPPGPYLITEAEYSALLERVSSLELQLRTLLHVLDVRGNA